MPASSPSRTEEVLLDDVLLAKAKDGSRFYLTLNLRHSERSNAQTVEHEPITEYDSVTFMGAIAEGRRKNATTTGQIVGLLTYRDEFKPVNGFTEDDLQNIVQIWHEWHCNDMNAACAHMGPGALKRWQETGIGDVCETSGYRYGSAWLVKPLPAEVVAKVREIASGEHPEKYTGN